MSEHSPVRTCAGCGQRDSQEALQRFVIGNTGYELGCAEGRGGYLHIRESCWQAFLKRKSLYRTFRRDMSHEDREALVMKLRRRWSEK